MWSPPLERAAEAHRGPPPRTSVMSHISQPSVGASASSTRQQAMFAVPNHAPTTSTSMCEGATAGRRSCGCSALRVER